jgi:23S rRNA (uracil1939-C5)-methyltransferase
MPTGIIESLDHEARGVTRLDGKTVFVEGALPGESVEYASYRRKPTYELARTLRVLASSAERVTPRCPHFGVCGGCSMQHLDPAAQVAAKQRLLEDNLWHLGRIKADQLYAPIYGQPWGYRYRARLSVRFVLKKGGVLVGFHERKSSYVADMRQCEILPLHLSVLLLPLRDLIGQLSIRDRLPQIEVAVGERMTALVLRILEALNPDDEALLRGFADRHSVVFYLQPQGPATAYRFYPSWRASAVLPPPGLRGRTLLFADRVYPGQSRDQPRAGAPRSEPPRSAAGRARCRHVLRAGQLYAADCTFRCVCDGC